ncbi:MAG: hypothetical protein AB2A00_14940 [Myxococcota bacterium]
MKRLIALLLALVGVGCAGSRPSSSSTTVAPAGTTPDSGRPVEAGMAEQSGYLLLKDGSIHPDTDGRPQGLYVGGKLVDGRFTPEGNVQGDGPLGESGSPGWMELNDGSFHGDQTARPPFPPYIKGYRTREGEFRPKSRLVNY